MTSAVLKRKASRELEVQQSASPVLEKNKNTVRKMQKTPQANLTQTKLTGFGVMQSSQGQEAGQANKQDPRPAGPPSEAPRKESVGASDGTSESMEISGEGAIAPSPQVITADFLLKALQDNKDNIVKSFNITISALLGRVDNNAEKISSNTANNTKNSREISEHNTEILRLTSRVEKLEKVGRQSCVGTLARAQLSGEYIDTRRSVRLWPIRAGTDTEMWGKVGEFLHLTLGIWEEHMCQRDIESITKVDSRTSPGNIKDEVIVKFYDKKKSRRRLCQCK